MNFANDNFRLMQGDCLELMRGMPDNSVDSIVTDPPYELGFMGKGWDKSGIANNVDVWREALRVLKPGGHLLAFSGSRTYHRMVCAIEDAGFEIRDQIMWLYSSGFPKSLDVSKAIDKAAGAAREVIGTRRAGITPRGNLCRHGVTEDEKQRPVTAPATDAARQWQGWGTALKPAHEPICVARKPLAGTVAANVLQHGTGALNIDGCRVPAEKQTGWGDKGAGGNTWNETNNGLGSDGEARPVDGRWPANVIHDGSEEVLAGFPETRARGNAAPTKSGVGMFHASAGKQEAFSGDYGSAARFFYCAKASKRDRDEGLESFANRARPTMGDGIGGQPDQSRANNKNIHPTVKPTDLMRYLVRLVTPPGGTVLDPFMGSGSTGKAAVLEGFRFVGCDLSNEYLEIARARILHAANDNTPPAANDNAPELPL